MMSADAPLVVLEVDAEAVEVPAPEVTVAVLLAGTEEVLLSVAMLRVVLRERGELVPALKVPMVLGGTTAVVVVVEFAEAEIDADANVVADAELDEELEE